MFFSATKAMAFPALLVQPSACRRRKKERGKQHLLPPSSSMFLNSRPKYARGQRAGLFCAALAANAAAIPNPWRRV